MRRARSPRSLRERDARVLGRERPAEDVAVVRTEGDHVVDARGRRYVDVSGGWCVGNLGWGLGEVEDAVASFDGPTYVAPHHLYAGWVELAELLEATTPGRLRTSFRATGGTEAVDLALQAAMAHTGRRRFVSLEGAYHGNSIATLSLGDDDEDRPSPMPSSRKLAPPLDGRAADRLERILAREDVAAFVLEPVVVNLGVLVPDEEFVRRAAAACRRHGTLLVADEVACGFGRTGPLFACEHHGIRPDVLCLAKGGSAGAAAWGAMVATPAVARSMAAHGSFYSTYGWHPRSVAAALAAIRYLRRHASRIRRNVEAMERRFVERLARMPFGETPVVRAKGLAIAVEFRGEGPAERVVERAREAGVLLAGVDERRFGLFPALTVTEDVAEEGLDRLERSLGRRRGA